VLEDTEVKIMKNNLRALRKSKGYTQIAVQMKTGIEQALLSKFENGERIPPTEMLVRLRIFTMSAKIISCAEQIIRNPINPNDLRVTHPQGWI